MTYNGWTNYATWGVALVLDNDEGTYLNVRDQLEMERASTKSDGNVLAGIWTEEECVRFRFADWLRDYVEELCGLEGVEVPEECQPTLMARQVIQAGLAEVNWDEIVGHYVDDES